jgi:GNAT superfamily N-acetyltransferase
MPGDLDCVRALVREAADWLQASKSTDQWARPWPNRAAHRERMLNDLIKGKVWIVWDGQAAAATITVDTEEPLNLDEQPIWPPRKRQAPAMYVRRVVVSRNYAGLGLGAALLDWAAEVARTDYAAAFLRIDVWTTNLGLHAYYKGQGFTRCQGRDPRELGSYPSQALFERDAHRPGSDFTQLFTAEALGDRKFP